MKKVLCLIALIAATSVSAQPPDVPRSRHDGLVGSCGSCVPASDGVIHFRFSPGSGIVTETIGGTPTKRLNLIMQVRGSKKMTERPQLIDQVSAGINYNETTFGPRLYTPAWFNLFGTPVANAQCTATRSDFFTGGEASYVLVVTDDSSSILGLTEETTSITNNTASPSTFATLTDKFVDFITITCNVIDEETEADISFTAVAADATGVRLIDVNDANDPIIRRSILPVADNDLRGFRLDGKTWAEDYSRYSDGWGVRLKFSKGVYADNGGTKEALTAANFLLYSDSNSDSTTSTVSNVEHTADDPYVKITIADPANLGDPPPSPPAGAVIRLVSNATSTVKDIDDNELADGNFVASLEYDSNAPQVASITTDSSFTTAQQSRWTIVFDQPIHADTAIKENLCLTDRNGACAAADAAPTTPSIVSVIAGTADNIVTDGMVSTMTVVVNEGLGKTGGARSIEFRRNAILAGNLYIAEDYQTELRDKIMLQNRIGPVITVTDASMDVDPDNEGDYLEYEVRFTVTADEDVPSLADPDSYGLRADFSARLIDTIFMENSANATDLMLDGRPNRQVRLVYNVTFNTAGIVRGTNRMVLVRASDSSLLDDDPINPLGPSYINTANVAVDIDAGGELDPQGGVRASARVPNRNKPIITAVAGGDAMVDSNARQYRGSFTVTVDDASNVVPKIGDPASYVLLREQNDNDNDSLEKVSTARPTIDSVNLTAGKVTTKTAVINFSVTLATLDDARATRYFTLGRADPSTLVADELLDIYSNQPVRSDNTLIADGARISTGAASQANRVGENARLTVTATEQKANPDASIANRYSMTFTVTACAVSNETPCANSNLLSLSDIGDLNAYKLRHLVSSGNAMDLTPIRNRSSNRLGSGSDATLSYTVTFPDTSDGIADAQRTRGFTLEYADNTKLLSSSGDFPARAGTTDNTGILSAGDRIDNRATAVAARDTTAPSIAIADPTENSADAVTTTDSGATYTFSFRATASEPVQDLLEKGSYSLLVARTEADIGNDNLTDTGTSASAITATATNTAKLDYRIALSDIRTLLGESSNSFVPYGFLLARKGTALRDASNNDPVQVDADGNPTTTTLSSDNTVRSVLQLGKAAVLEQDQDGAVITLTADTEAVPDDDNRFGEVYDMTFTVEASEDVTGIGDIDNYTLMRVKANNIVETAVISGDPNAIRVSSSEDSGNPADAARGTSATFTYAVTFRRDNDADLDDRIRDTKGFTLALATGAPAAGALQNVANNLPVNTDGEEIYNDADALQRQGLIPPKPSNAAPEVIAARDTTAPTIGYAPNPAGSLAQPNDDDPTVYSGSFTVTSTAENIRDIGTPGAYTLRRARKTGGLRDVSGGSLTLTSPSDNDANRDGMSAIINFSGADVGSLADARETRSFFLQPNVSRDDGTRLRDYSNNNVAFSGVLMFKDTTDPVITVRAIGADANGVHAQPTTTDGTGYTMQFTVTADEEVPTLNNTSSYNLAGIDINDGTTVTIVQNNVTPVLEDGHTTTKATITYTVTGITNPTSLAGFTLLRNGAESLRDKSGNLPAVNNGARIDSNTAAIAARDTTPPRITVTGMPATVDASGNYTLRFTVSATEDVKDLNLATSYRLLSINHVNSVTEYVPERSPSAVTEVTVNREYTIQYTINPMTEASADRGSLRQRRGFTIGRLGPAGSNVFIDRSGNSPVKADGTTSIANDDFFNSIIGPITVGTTVADAAVSLIEKTPPQITVTAVTSATIVSVSGNDITLSGTFTVTADEDILGIGLASSYKLIRVLGDNSTEDITTATLMNGANANSDNAEISYDATIRSQDVEDTAGFTLVRADDATASDSLIDYASNIPVDPGDTSNQINSAGERLDSRASAISLIDTSAPDQDTPIITVRAIDIAGDIGTDSDGVFAEPPIDGDGSRYTMAFKVTANKEVPTLNNTASYNLAGVSISDGNLVAIDQSNVTPAVDPESDSRATTLNYTVTGVSAPTSLAGFTLIRNGAASLVDESANQPAVADGERIDDDDAAIAYRDRTPPTVTITASGSSPKAMPTADDGTMYEMVFNIVASEFIYTRAIGREFHDLATVALNSAEIVPLNVPFGDENVGGTSPRNRIFTYTNITVTDPTSIAGFTVVLQQALTDWSGNPLVYAGTTRTVVVGTRIDDRDAALADRDTMPPSITVVPSQFIRIGDQICGSFSVSGDEAIDGINSTASYSLLRIGSDGTTVEAAVTTAGPADARCEGHGSVISSSTPTATTAVLNATIHFNVVDSEVTAAHKYTLGRKAKLTDTSGNPPVDTVDNSREITATADAAGRIDSRDAALGDIPAPPAETTPPQITITATDQMATADANDNYAMEFTVSANEAVPTLGDASSYELRRIKNDDSIADDANATAGNPVQATLNRQYTISYTADLSALSAAERRNTKGFTLVRASTTTLVDRSGNQPVKADGTTAIGLGDPIAAVTGGVVAATAIAARETVRPQIEVRPVLVDGFGAVPRTSNPRNYLISFTVRSVNGETIKNLGDLASYTFRRILKDGSIGSYTPLVVRLNSDAPVNSVNSTLGFQAIFGQGREAEIRDTAGFILVAETPLNLTDYASNLPQGVNNVGDRIDTSDAAVALRDTQGPQITVVAGNDGNAVVDETNPLLYTGSFTVAAPEGKTIPGLGTAASYKLLRIDAEDNPIDVTTTAMIEVTDAQAANASTATLTFTATLANMTEVQDTKGFTLGYAANLLDPILRNLPVQSENGRLDTRADAIASIEGPAPIITVRAIDIAGDEGTDNDGVFAEPAGALNGSEYTLAFRVASDKEVATLNSTASYSLAGVSMSDGNLVAIDQSNVTAVLAAGHTTTEVRINYTVTGISDPTSLAGFTLVRSGAESLVDESGNPPAAADGARIDSNDLAIAYRDRTPPRLTVSAMPATANASNSYSIRFTVTVNPNENVANLCALNPPPYLARGIRTNNELYTLDFGISSRLTDSGTEGTSCRIQYNGVPALDRDVIRDTRGFVLVRSNANILIDNSGNPAVKSDGTAIVANQVISDNAVSARDNTPPQITVTATDATVSSSGDDINFAGTFTVTAGENILSIGSVDAYRLMRVLTSGDADVAIDATLSRDSGSVNSDMAVISYSATLSGTSARSDTIATKGFTLARKNAVSDISNELLDYASNIPVDPGDTSDPVNSANERLDSRDSAISPIDTSAPSITVTALDDEATPVRVSNTTNTYIMRFRINADKTVSDIGDPAAYTLMRIPSNGTTPLAITTTGVRAQPNIAVRVATTSTIILFTGQFTATQIADEQDTVGFTLGRATDADSGGNCRLCGIDKPTRGGGGSGTGDIEAGARIDKSSASVVARDTTSPQIQVLEFGDMTATEGMSGISANGAFTVQFEVHEDAAEIPDINDQSREPYRILRKHSGSDDFSVVNSRQGGQAIATIGQCQDSSLTNIVNCWEITATELVLPIADALNTEHFTLGRAPDRLRDASNNDPIVADLLPETIVRASDADAPLPLDWDTDANYELEREKPSITVRPSPFARIDDDQVCGSFRVSGADITGNEPIDGINSTASYSLLRIDPDGTVSELTTAGDANVRCTGHGSVISAATPVSTDDVPFPSLLRATIYFNVMDSEVTTAHKYTLGRKESLTDISGNPLVDTVDGTREITATADVDGRIDSRDAARGDIPIPSTDMTLPIITATVQDIDDDTSDMVEAVPDANNPLSFSGRFRVEVQQPDGEEENVASIGEEASYQVVYISITNNQEVAISNQTITISNVTVNRAATVSFTAVLPNIAAVQDVAAFKLKPVDLVDSGGNAPLNNEFTSTSDSIDTTEARRERTSPRITITAVDQAATADANDNYTMQFTVSANEAVATLGSASSYGVRRIDNDNNLRSDANATASNPVQVTANRQYTISYTANLSGLSDAEIRNTKGFTLVRVGTSRLIDRSGNPPVKADGSTAIANGAVIAAVTNNVVAATAVAARETARPQIEVRAVNVGGFGAVPHATLENTYEGSFTVRSVSAENIKGLGATASYTLQQVLVVGSNNTAQPTMIITSSSDSSATVSVTIGFQATFTGTQAEIDEAVRSTDGFTLSAGSLSLTDYASNLPQGISNVGDRLDTSDNAVAKVDRRAPRITVVAGNDGNAVADETDPLVYTGSFTVTAPADKPITGLATTASYKVLRISLDDSPFDVDNATITPQGTGDETAAMFGFTAKLADIKTVQKTKGFTLGYLANLRDSSGIIPQQFGGGRLDDREAAIARVSLVRVECAPFYPNIGQQDLFFKVTSESEPNLNGLTLTQGGTTLFNSTDTAVMEGSDGEFAILKERVSSEITDSAPISVSYADGARTVQTSCAIDNLANLTDSDGDGVIDIVDSNPYDSSVTAINDTVASASLAATPASTDTFYNRRVLVRSLLRGNEFTYVEGGEIKMAGVTALTAAEYFGIDYAAKTHLLAVESDSDCALILAAAQENKLSQVNFSVFCASEDLGVAEEYDFVDKVSITERQRYVWVGVDSDGRLKPSEYPDHTISALPEINISGQSSYFYTAPTTKSLIISAYAPDDTNEDIQITVKGTVVSGNPIADERVILQRRAATDVPPVFVGPKVYSGIHPVTGSGKNPQAGQTIRHWLIGDTLAATINVWHATEAKLTLPTSGGYTIFDDAKYAIGDYSHVDVRMAKDGSSEPITEIHQLLLYDVTETTVSRVTSAVQGRDYYLIADLTTNIENIGGEVLVAMPQGGYTIRTTANVVIRNNIGNSGHLIEQESFELIAFRVNSDAGDTISVGWDKIGTAENIVASYRVTADIPLNYNLPGSDHGDRDGDRILDDLDRLPDWPFSLPVAVDNEINPDIDWLGAVAWYDQPLYVSDEGLIIAAAKGNDKEIDYSAANIAYSGLTTDTRTQLGFTDDDSITSLATFGIRSVDYGFSQEANADAMVVGGKAYAVFPIEAGTPNQPLYISRYNEEAGRWERFERGTHRDGYADTWYVIDREMINGESTYCPLDVGVYRNEYMTAGVGFTANNQKCVLVAITDGGPYDNSGINGRIDALLAIAELRSPSRRLLQCAAFYANVGQKELFFELNGIGFDANGFAIEQGGNSLDVDSALQINTDAMDGVDPIVKLTLSEEIVSLADIIVTYTAAGEGPSETMCVASLKEDTDDDGVADIVDENPFDADDMKPNPDITGPPADNDDLFVESDIFYSRSVVVRSLLRGEAFTYIEEDENDKPIRMTHTGTMTPAEYFGVDADARIYEYSEMCEAILATAQANGLSQVRLDEFCTEDISDDFVDVINNDFVERGSDGHRYLWATVRDGFLVGSYIGEKVSILPEINFLGQDTYLFAGPTTKTVIISAYVSHVGAPTQISVKGASTDEDNDFSDSEEVTLMGTDKPKDKGTILGRYNITSDSKHPQSGETITRWLSALMGATNIWQPKGETLMTQEGGHDNELSGYMYAIGSHNNIDVRVADPENEAVTEIRQVLLYEVTDSDPPIRRVTSMVAGRTYYVAVDFDTNIADEEIEIEPAVQHMALYTITTATHHVARVRDAGHLEKEEVAIIVITVADDISTDTAVITVGWNKVGSVENVISRYLVRNKNTDPLLDYALVDADLDGIPDDYDRHANDNHRLQISIGDDIESDRDFLATQDGNPTFLTYEGLVIADAMNNISRIPLDTNYSVSADYEKLDDNTKRLLDIEIDDADEIDTIATFGVAGVDYGFELEGNRANPTGGEVYASFPLVVVDPSLNGETLYLGKYDYATGSWVRFERGTVVTWYAIDRPDVGACPTDVQVYQNQHQASGDEGMGFTAGPTGNCIMLVLSDGVRLYDSSSLDGRVLDPLSIGTKLFDKAREQPSQPHRRGGGGAIGVSDILLLIGALVLITVASRKRRKAQ